MKTLIRIILGTIFIVSGVAKAVDTQSFITLIEGYNIGFLAYGAIVIPPLEILLGLFFWFNIEIKTAALIMAISTAFFSLIFLEVYFTKGITDCGCFGSIKWLKMPPWASVLRNVIIVAGAWYLYKFPPAESPVHRKSKLIVTTILVFVAFTASAISYTKPLVNVKAINHESLVGRDVETTFLKKYGKFDPKKRYAVFMFSPECYHCWDMTMNVKSLTESGYVDETMAFAPFELMEEEKGYDAAFKPNFKVNFISQKDFSDVTSSTPVLMIIQNNKVIQYNNSGVIHSGYTIKKFMDKK